MPDDEILKYTGLKLSIEELEKKIHLVASGHNHVNLITKIEKLEKSLEPKLKLDYMLKMNQLVGNDKAHQALHDKAFKELSELKALIKAHDINLDSLGGSMQNRKDEIAELKANINEYRGKSDNGGEKTVDTNNPMSSRSGMKISTASKPPEQDDKIPFGVVIFDPKNINNKVTAYDFRYFPPEKFYWKDGKMFIVVEKADLEKLFSQIADFSCGTGCWLTVNKLRHKYLTEEAEKKE